MGTYVIVLIAAVVFIAFYLIYEYNRLVRARNKVREAFSAIDVQLERRFDTLTKIAETVVSYAKHEQNTFTEVTRIREGLADAKSTQEKMEDYNKLDDLLSSINVQVENYPELRASENYMQLQRTTNEIEERLSAIRRTYNANVIKLNNKLETIPTNIYAGKMGFQKEVLYETVESKREDVNMSSLLRG